VRTIIKNNEVTLSEV